MELSERSGREGGKRGYEKFEKEAKETMFGVLFLLLKEEEKSLWKVIIMLLIDFCQLLTFPFNPNVNFPWKAGSFLFYMKDFLGIFQLVYWMANLAFETYLLIFYSGITLVVLVLLDITYVSYALSKKNLTLLWPVKLLRNVVSLFVTVLFLPLLQLFVSMLACAENETETGYVHSNYRDVECWTGTHIIHAVAAILVSILFIIISIIVCLTYYESRTTTNDPSARTNSRTDTFHMIDKILCIALFTFCNQDKFMWMLAIVIVISSSIFFYKMKIFRPYYNEYVASLWIILSGLYMWTNLVLLLSLFLKDTSFSGSIQIYICGCPFVIIYLATQRHPVEKYLLLPQDQHNSPETYILVTRYLVNFAFNPTEKNRLYLDSYATVHIARCKEEDCMITKFLQQGAFSKRNLGRMGEEGHDRTQNKRAIYQQILMHANELYLLAINTFPQSTFLRISYAFFVLERLENKKDALKELTQAAKLHPEFDEQFVIFRYKQIIEDSISSSGEFDYCTFIAFNNHLSQCELFIEKVANYKKQLWAVLSYRKPDLNQLINYGFLIHQTIELVESHWSKLLKINNNMSDAMKKYASFVINILGDTQRGNALMRQANRGVANFVFDANNEDYHINKYSENGIPVLILSPDKKSIGTILNTNAAMCSVSGYTENELVQHNIKMIQPEIIAKDHDSYLLRALQGENSTLIGVQTIYPVKHKSGYLFMAALCIRSLPSIFEGARFVGTLAEERKISRSNSCFFILDLNLNIREISDKCMTLLRWNKNFFKDRDIKLEKFIKEINIDGLNVFIDPKETRTITFKHIMFTEEQIMSGIFDDDIGVPGAGGEEKFDISIQPIRAQNVIIGHVVMLTPPKDEDANLLANNPEMLKPKKPKNEFQFFFNPMKHQYGRRVKDPNELNVDPNISSKIQNRETSLIPLGQTSMAHAYHSLQKHQINVDDKEEEDKITKEKELENSNWDKTVDADISGLPVVNIPKKGRGISPFTDYGRNIQTRRLINDSFEDVKDNQRPNEFMSGLGGEEEEETELEMDEETKKQRETQTLKIKKDLALALAHQKTPPFLKCLRYFSLLLVLLFFGMAIAQYITLANYLSNISDNNQIAWKHYKINAYLVENFYVVRTLTLISSKYLTNYQNCSTKEEFTTLQNDRLHVILREMDFLMKNVSFEPKLFTEVKDLLNKKELKIVYQLEIDEAAHDHADASEEHLDRDGHEGESNDINYIQAILQMISNSFVIMKSELSEIKIISEPVYDILYNALNVILETSQKVNKKMISTMDDEIDELELFITIFQVCAFILCFISALSMVPFILKAYSTKEKTLNIFLEIPKSRLNILFNKAEAYHDSLQKTKSMTKSVAGSQDDDQFQEQTEEEVTETTKFIKKSDSDARHRVGRNKSFARRRCLHIVKILFITTFLLLIFESFFIFVFGYANAMVGKFVELIDFKNSIGIHISEYELAISDITQILSKSPMPILHMTPYTASTPLLDDLTHHAYDLDHNALEVMKINWVDPSMEDYKTWMYHAFCAQNYNRYYFNVADCDALGNGIAKTGLQVVFSYFRENYKSLIQQFNAGINPNGLLNSNAYHDLHITGHYFSRIQFQDFGETIVEDTTDIVDNYIRYFLFALLGYVFFLFLMFLVCWLPYIASLKKDIFKTMNMISLIPLNVLIELENVQMSIQQTTYASTNSA